MKAKALSGLVVGGVLAFAIACGGGAKKSADMPPRADLPPRSDARAELERLDQEITAQMQQLGEPRPNPPVAACVENCPQPMIAPVDPATCVPAKTDTCTQACTLKDSICTNAQKICALAAELGGNDPRANETCNRGVASCEAAKTRCCGCM